MVKSILSYLIKNVTAPFYQKLYNALSRYKIYLNITGANEVIDWIRHYAKKCNEMPLSLVDINSEIGDVLALNRINESHRMIISNVFPSRHGSQP